MNSKWLVLKNNSLIRTETFTLLARVDPTGINNVALRALHLKIKLIRYMFI